MTGFQALLGWWSIKDKVEPSPFWLSLHKKVKRNDEKGKGKGEVMMADVFSLSAMSIVYKLAWSVAEEGQASVPRWRGSKEQRE